MGIAKNKNYKIKYLFAIVFYLFSTNYAFSAYEKPYNDYQLDVETDLYDNYDEEVETFYDPFEKFNRKIFNFNISFNKYITEPVGKSYRFVTTKGMRRSIDNVLKNLRSPVILINSILQLDMKNSARTISSFAINSTIGVLGLFNPAKKMEIYNENADFGQTLGKWKVGTGPYLVLPILGPSNFRDGSGILVDKAIDPLDYNILEFGGKKPLVSWKFRWIRTGFYALNISNFVVETFTPLLETSFDPYVMTRNAYLQNRKYKINK